MGSGASSSAKRIDNKTDIQCLENSKDVGESTTVRSSSVKTHSHRRHETKIGPITKDELTEMKTEVHRCQTLLAAAQENVGHANDDANEKEAEMATIEGQNLELLDQVAALEEEIEALQRSSGTTTDWTETLKAKDQYIEYLENQAEMTQQQTTMLKKKFKRRLRLLNRQLSEAKQGQSVQLFEQQQEHDILTDENNRLKEQLRKLPVPEDGTTEEFSDNRTKIILELSAKVSEQDSQITNLELKLAEKHEIDKSQNDSEGKNFKAVTSDASLWSTNSATPELINKTKLLANAKSTAPNKVRGAFHDDEELNDLKSLAAEMKQLQKKTKTKKETDFRESSGVSRDSGIVTLTNGNYQKDSKKSDSDWEDSDSDFGEKSGHGGRSVPSSAQSRISAHSEGSHCSDTENGLNGTKELDPYSIRKISAAKLRKGKKVHAGLKSHNRGKPPHYEDRFKYSAEVDALINDLDTSGSKVKGPVPVS